MGPYLNYCTEVTGGCWLTMDLNRVGSFTPLGVYLARSKMDIFLSVGESSFLATMHMVDCFMRLVAVDCGVLF